jgi:D-amino peptidase
MRVLVLGDLEGVAGVSRWEQTRAGSLHYEEARRLYTEELNAAVRGAAAAGADEIVVVDMHGAGGGGARFNSIIAEAIDDRCSFFVQDHWTEFECLLERGCSAAILVGMHAMAGAEHASLCHTVSAANWWRVAFDGVDAGEIAIAAALCGTWDCPVVFVSGDAAACAEATALLGEDLRTVSVKEAFGDFSALHLSPQRARKRIEEEVRSALVTEPRRSPLRLEGPCEIALDLTMPAASSAFAHRPGVDQVGPRCVVSRASTWREAWRQIDR